MVADFLQMQVHGLAVGARHDDRGGLAKRRANRPEEVGRVEPQVARRRRPRAGLRPHPSQLVLLTDARFVLKPDFDSFAVSFRRRDSA